MKQIILGSAILVLMIGQAFAVNDPVPDSIRAIFQKQFPDAASYNSSGDAAFYYFSFSPEPKVRASATYDRRGRLLQVIKYYPEEELDPFIREKVKARYPGAIISGVTEGMTNDRHVYEFIINHSDSWSCVRYDPLRGFYNEKTYQRLAE